METQKEAKGEISTEQLDTDSLNLILILILYQTICTKLPPDLLISVL